MQAAVLKPTSVASVLAIVGLLALCLLFPVTPAHAQPILGDAVEQATGAVESTVGTVGKTVTEAGAKAGDTVTDTGGTVGDAVGGNTGATVKDTTATAGSTVKDTSAGAGSLLDGATKDVSGGAEGITRVIDRTLGEAGVDLDESGKKGPTHTGAGTGTDASPTTFLRVPDRLLDEASILPTLLTPTNERGVSATSAQATESPATLADVVRRALQAVEKFAFPLALTLLVLAYLSIQGRFDRRDPKLALASVDPDAELLRFE